MAADTPRKGISIDLPTGKISDGDIPATVARMTDVVAAQAAAQAASQPLDADLTAYAGAVSSAARRALINAEEAGAAAATLASCTVQVGLAEDAADAAALSAGTATTQAGLAAGSAGTATTQAGLAAGSAGTATAQAGIATTQAGLASTSAGTATTQAGISTTQAGISTAKALEAAGSALDALAFRNEASGFKDTATAQAGISTAQAVIATAQAVIAAAKAAEATADVDLIEAFALTATTQAGIATAQAVLADADRVQTNADRVQTGLDVIAAEADRVATAADRVQTGLDRVATAADRVQTGLDRTQTGTDRASATASAASATTSASTALNARALQFKGGIAGNSVPATSALAGDYYQITIAGTSQSKTWAVGDEAIYNGTSGSWTQITGYFAPITSAFVSYMPDGYLNSDGATANRAQIYGPFDAVNNPREYVAGAATLTLAGIVTVPTTTQPTGTLSAQIAAYGPNINIDVGRANSLIVVLNLDSLYISQLGSIAGSNYRTFQWASFRTTYSGQTIYLKITFTKGTTNPVVEVNGVGISANFALTSVSAPEWLDASMVPTYRQCGLLWPAGPAPIVTPILGTTSAADDAFYLSTGKWPAWVVAGGSCAAIPSAGTFINAQFITINSAGATGANATATASNARLSSGTDLVLEANAYYEVKFTSDLAGIGYQLLKHAVGTFSSNTVNTVVGANVGILFCNTSTTAGRVTWVLSSGQTIDISGWSIRKIGALSLSAIQPINVVDDVSGIGGNQGRLLGMTPVTDKRSTRTLGRINAASATNQQILGGALLPVPLNYAHEFVDVETDGSVTLSLGDGTTATRYTASTALTAGRTRITLTTPFAADAAKTGLYVNVTVAGGTYAQFSILGHILK